MRGTIQTLTLNTFRSLPAEEIYVERFCASPSWVDDFMQRAGFCLRIPHPEWQCIIDESMVLQFKSRL
jgi:hypothetical protein